MSFSSQILPILGSLSIGIGDLITFFFNNKLWLKNFLFLSVPKYNLRKYYI